MLSKLSDFCRRQRVLLYHCRRIFRQIDFRGCLFRLSSSLPFWLAVFGVVIGFFFITATTLYSDSKRVDEAASEIIRFSNVEANLLQSLHSQEKFVNQTLKVAQQLTSNSAKGDKPDKLLDAFCELMTVSDLTSIVGLGDKEGNYWAVDRLGPERAFRRIHSTTETTNRLTIWQKSKSGLLQIDMGSYDCRKRPWFPVGKEKVRWSPLYPYATGDTFGANISSVATNKAGKEFVVTASISFDQVNQLLVRNSPRPHIFCILTDGHQSASTILAGNMNHSKGWTRPLSVSELQETEGMHGVQKLLMNPHVWNRASTAGFRTNNLSIRVVKTSFAGRNCSLVLAAHDTLLFSRSHPLAKNLILISFGGIAFAALFVWFISAAVIHPVKSLVVHGNTRDNPFKDPIRQVVSTLEALRAALKEAKASNENIQRFIATISHELRSPLQNIVLTLEYLHLKLEDQTLKAYTANLGSSAARVKGIVNEILEYAKASSGPRKVNLVCVDLHTVVSEVFTSHREAARQKALEYNLTISEQFRGGWECDKEKLEKVLDVLIDNAIKYCDSGSVSLNVLCEPSQKQNAGFQAVFEVSDTGPGIREEDKARIFLPFEQGDSSLSKLKGGTGLGLATSQEYVTLMGGKICVVTNPNITKGATFKFSVNLKPCDLPKKATDSSSSNKGAIKHGPIVVVDDEELNVEITSLMLRDRGFLVLGARSGQEALNHLNELPAAFVLDVRMPGMDGIAVARMIRENQDEKVRNTCIIGLTADTSDRMQDSGMDLIVQKPCNVEQLAKILEAFSILPQTKAAPMSSNEVNVTSHPLANRYEPERLRRYERLLFEKAPSQLKDINDALNQESYVEAENTAHTLAGTLSNFYDQPCNAAVRNLREFIHKGEKESAIRELTSLESALVELRKVIKDILKSHENPNL